MSEYIEEKLSTKVVDKYDVIVVGGGPAGVGTAVTAARKGLKTLLVEQYGFLGGTWTAAMVTPLFDGANKGGFVKEIIDGLTERGQYGAFWDISFDFEGLKKLLDEKVQQAGVTVLFHTYFCAPIMQDNRVCGVIVQNKGGRMAFTAKYVVDCTGDGDVAVSAGASYVYGNGDKNSAQAMTTMFLLSNVTFRQNDQYELYERMKKACATYDTGYEIDFDSPYAIWLPLKDFVIVQLVHIRGKDGTDPFSLSEAEFAGRARAYETFEFFKHYIPEFKDAQLVATPTQIGVRETRHIIGEYYLTKEDMLRGARFEDSLGFQVTFNVDIHDEKTEQECFHISNYEIPLRCLLPKGIDGLLVAGRCISGDFYAHASYRVTGNCVAMGEGAANAIALSLAQQCDIREI